MLSYVRSPNVIENKEAGRRLPRKYMKINNLTRNARMLLKMQEIAFKKEWQVAKSRVRSPVSEVSSLRRALSLYGGL
jgi:hypothetical protein